MKFNDLVYSILNEDKRMQPALDGKPEVYCLSIMISSVSTLPPEVVGPWRDTRDIGPGVFNINTTTPITFNDVLGYIHNMLTPHPQVVCQSDAFEKLSAVSAVIETQPFVAKLIQKLKHINTMAGQWYVADNTAANIKNAQHFLQLSKLVHCFFVVNTDAYNASFHAAEELYEF